VAAVVALASLVAIASIAGAQYAHRQNRWARYEREMQDPIDDPPDAWDKTEFAFARLRYRSPRDAYFRRCALGDRLQQIRAPLHESHPPAYAAGHAVDRRDLRRG